MSVIFAPSAKLDLLKIGEHIKRDNPARAVSFVEELVDRCYTLTDSPRRYPLVPRYEHWGIRRCAHGNYLIFYRVRTDGVDIVHVLHGAMDYESILFPDS
jgi:plasmid stabilization system protein ParE